MSLRHFVFGAFVHGDSVPGAFVRAVFVRHSFLADTLSRDSIKQSGLTNEEKIYQEHFLYILEMDIHENLNITDSTL